MSDETIRDATEISLEAERKLGAVLAEAPKNQGAIPGKIGTKSVPVLDETPTLADLGISKKTSEAMG